jgi:hypothetical protein
MASAITHFEIHVDDVESAKQFYSSLFGWEFTAAGMGETMEYWLIKTGRTTGMDGGQIGIDGGMVKYRDKPTTVGPELNALLITVQVDDVEATVAKAKDLGGKVTTDRMDIPNVGIWYGLNDPSGNAIGVLQSATS